VNDTKTEVVPVPTAADTPVGTGVATSSRQRKKMSPRKRALVVRTIQYAVFAILVVVVLAVANWPQIGSVFFRPKMIDDTITRFIQLAPGSSDRMVPALALAFGNTLAYSIGAFIIGLLLGTVLALMKLSSIGPYRWLSTLYTEIFRGLPALVILMMFGFLPLAFPGLVLPLDPYGTVWVALGMVYASYMSETIRAGIQAVPIGQVEAARTLGMPAGMAMRRIVLPQAFRIITPPLTNDLIALVKDSSLVYVLGLSVQGFELTRYGRDITNTNANLTPLVVAGLCYLLITVPLGFLVRRMEAKGRTQGGSK